MTNHQTTTRLTTAQAVVSYLQQQWTERDGQTHRLVAAMFGIFGHGNVAGLGQALQECGDRLPYLQGRNEQSMVHAATGYAKAMRRRSTLAVTTSIGPGSTNMITGAATATVNRIPVLLLPADVYVTRYQGPALQQLEHPLAGDVSVNDCFRPVSRFFDRINRPEQLLTALPEVMRVLTSPSETGAVTLALPQDVQAHAYHFPSHFFDSRTWAIARPVPELAAVKNAVHALAAARRPAIIAGGGVLYSEAEAELAAFAEQLGLPIAETFGGKGSVREDAWYGLGGIGIEGTPAANEILRRSDAVLCVGTRLTDFTTASRTLFADPDVRFIAINVDSHDAHKMGALAVSGDARESLAALRAAADEAGLGFDRREEVGTIKRAWASDLEKALEPVTGEKMNQGQLIRTLNEFAQPGDTVIAAAGGPPGDLLKIWDATGGRACHLEFGFSCMGYEIPAGVGVRLAQPEGEVYVYIGDGTYLMNPTELVTALQEGLKITVVIAENHGFQVIRRLQLVRDGVSFGNEFRAREGHPTTVDAREGTRLDGEYLNLDLAATARGFGAVAFEANDFDSFEEALNEAQTFDGPSVIVVEVEPHRFLPPSGAWFDVAPAEVSNQEAVQELRREYEAVRDHQQRFYY